MHAAILEVDWRVGREWQSEGWWLNGRGTEPALQRSYSTKRFTAAAAAAARCHVLYDY